ncbi:MAG: DUF5686 family protein [Saprospiraceae bacterium]|nr:DUF5686 family protein [Saprospiraceae bacterium]|tara:strand:- start:6268 stop:8817 length:2550 start_codon:yes stop_codon:yes gene_type:complete
MKKVLTILSLFIISSSILAQGVTKVRGKVFDIKTGEPLPFVSVFFTNSNVGTTTDLDGVFSIDTRYATESVTASFLGYEDMALTINKEVRNDLIFRLKAESLQLQNVTVIAKKGRYRKKGNPAVELMRKVIKNKGTNRLEGQDFYKHDQYERIELDINNITEEFKSRKIFNKFELLWNYLDTSEVNGKVFLPIYLQEVNSEVHFRKNPKDRKEIRDAIRMTKFDETIDDKSLTDMLDFLYQDVDIYNNSVPILDNSFVSPISPLALNFYRFYILDSLVVNDTKSIRLGFIPKNKANFGFTGDLYVSDDAKNRVVKADFGIIGDIHLNFVRDLKVIQEFEPYDSAFIKTKDEIVMDFSVAKNGLGFYGTRSIVVDNFDFEEPKDKSNFNHVNKVVIKEGAYDRSSDYWRDERLVSLTENQEGLYEMIDTLVTLPAYRRLISGVRIFTTGYAPFPKFDLGPLPTFYSFNQVEGSRFKLGVETNFDFNKKLLLDGYVAYGTRDKRFKYKGSLTYSFNEDYKVNPRHYLRATYQQEVTFPGQALQFIQGDNLLLSARRGATNRMILEKELSFEYTKELPSVAVDFMFSDKGIVPYGDLVLPFINEDGEPDFIDNIETTSFGVGLEFSPNKQFIQGRQYRTPIINEYPIFRLRYTGSFKGLLGSDYSYQRFDAAFFKRFNMSILGHMNVGIEAGKIFGELPYINLFIPRANQSFSYQRESFNMMNFLEFTADQYAFFRAEHFFKGFFFNRIPLFKKLKLREVASFKMVYGSLSDGNNPALNSSLPNFMNNEDGVPLTYDFDGTPYMEGSVGITNIFRVLRVDVVKRLNYLENPEIPTLFGVKGLGIRARFKVEF